MFIQFSKTLYSSMDALLSMVFVLPFLFLGGMLYFWKYYLKRNIMVILFALYLSFLLSMIGMPTIFGRSFHTVYFGLNYLGNLLLFLPIGIFLPVIWKRYFSLPKTVLTGLVIALYTVVSGLFSFYGLASTDILCLISDVLGVLIGYFLSGYLVKALEFDWPVPENNRYYQFEPVLILEIVFWAKFFITPLIFGFIL